MYKIPIFKKTSIEVNTSKEGESIEMKMERFMNNNEPITDGAQIIYTERRDGVRPEYNIRADKWDIAIDGMDKVASSYQERRKQNIKERGSDGEPDATIGKTEPVQGSEGV